MRRVLLLLALAGLTACAPPAATAGRATPLPGSQAPPSSAGPSSGPSDACADGAVVSVGAEDAAMGLRAVTLVLTACAPYEVDGYAEVTLLGEDGAPLDLPVATSGPVPADGSGKPLDPGPSRFTLAPGETAYAVLTWRLLVTEGDVLTAERISVVPVAGRPAQTLDLLVDPGTTRRVRLGAWAPGLPG